MCTQIFYPIAIFVPVCSGSKGLQLCCKSLKNQIHSYDPDEPDDCHSDDALALQDEILM